jgi:hypothetical protein
MSLDANEPAFVPSPGRRGRVRVGAKQEQTQT